MKKIVAFLVALLLCLPLSIISAGADTVSVTSPLEDLSACENFNVEDYPADAKDTSLSVIHVAETVDNKVLLYVYNPSQRLVASSANISLTETSPDRDILDYQLYSLTLSAEDGVFQKYIVDGLAVPDKLVRHYEIASILRPWDAAIDEAPTDDNTIHEVAYEVGYMWSYLSGDDGQYVVNRRNVITVTNKHVGFIRYKEVDAIIYSSAMDSHYVAFSTDKQIDKLLTVDLIYKGEETYYGNPEGILALDPNPDDYDSIGPIVVRLTSEQVFKEDSLFWGYEYERIQSVGDFLKKETSSLTTDTLKALSGTEWVLRFAETDYFAREGLGLTLEGWYVECVDISEVVLLRMEFENDGVFYNMGVVDDVQSGDDNPDNDGGCDYEWLLLIAAILIALLIALILIGVLAPVLKPLLSALVWVLLLPFKLLWWLIKALWGWIQKE